MFRSLRVRNYRLFAAGQLVSLTGSWMQTVGQDWLVLQLGGKGLALGFTTALQFVPMLMFGLYGGVIADRYDKRRLLMATQSAFLVLALALGTLAISGVAELWMVFVLAFVFGCVNAIDNPTRQSFVVEMVGPHDVVNAIALNSATFNSARIIGPAVAGVMIAAVGTGPVFFINAASFVAVLAGLMAMRDDEIQHAKPVSRARGQLREGLRYVMSRRDLLLPMILVGVIGMFGMNFQITLALVAKGTFHKGAETYGALSALLAAGALLGALASARRDRPRMSTLVVSALGFSLAEIVVALMPTLVTFGVLLIANGALLISFTSTANATVQLGAGPAMRGRVMALYGLVFLGGTPVGGPLIGWLAQHYGPRSGLLVGGFASLLVSVVVGTVMWRHDGRTWHHLRPHHLRRFYGEGYDVNALR